MGYALVRFGSSNGLPSRLERQTSREITLAHARGSVMAAREEAKVEAIASVTQTALLSASEISMLERLLVSQTPHAVARLQHIADAGIIGIGGVVARAGKQR